MFACEKIPKGVSMDSGIWTKYEKRLTETHLVFKGQSLSDVSREPIYDDTISVRDLHDLLLDLSYCCLLENSESNNDS